MKNILAFILLAFISISCVNRQKPLTEIYEAEQVNSDTIFYPTLHRVIDDLISLYDSTGRTRNNVIDISIIKERGDCIIKIHGTDFYAVWLKYYTFIDDRLIAIYDLDEDCNCGLVDTDKLVRFIGVPLEFILDTTMNYSVKMAIRKELENNITKIEGFKSEPDWQGWVMTRKYRIHNRDSLELIFTGLM